MKEIKPGEKVPFSIAIPPEAKIGDILSVNGEYECHGKQQIEFVFRITENSIVLIKTKDSKSWLHRLLWRLRLRKCAVLEIRG